MTSRRCGVDRMLLGVSVLLLAGVALAGLFGRALAERPLLQEPDLNQLRLGNSGVIHAHYGSDLGLDDPSLWVRDEAPARRWFGWR